MTRDRSDAIIVRFDPAGRAPRRIKFEPRDSEGGDWERIEEVWAGDDRGWRTVGSEIVQSVVIEDGRESTPAQTHLGDPRVDDGQQALDDCDE